MFIFETMLNRNPIRRSRPFIGEHVTDGGASSSRALDQSIYTSPNLMLERTAVALPESPAGAGQSLDGNITHAYPTGTYNYLNPPPL